MLHISATTYTNRKRYKWLINSRTSTRLEIHKDLQSRMNLKGGWTPHISSLFKIVADICKQFVDRKKKSSVIIRSSTSFFIFSTRTHFFLISWFWGAQLIHVWFSNLFSMRKHDNDLWVIQPIFLFPLTILSISWTRINKYLHKQTTRKGWYMNLIPTCSGLKLLWIDMYINKMLSQHNKILVSASKKKI